MNAFIANVAFKATKLIIEEREPLDKKLLHGFPCFTQTLVLIRGGEEIATLNRTENIINGNAWLAFITKNEYYMPEIENTAVGFDLIAIYDDCITIIDRIPGSRKKRVYF